MIVTGPQMQPELRHSGINRKLILHMESSICGYSHSDFVLNIFTYKIEAVSVFTTETFRGSLTGTRKRFYAVWKKLNSQSTVSYVPITFLHQLMPATLGV